MTADVVQDERTVLEGLDFDLVCQVSLVPVAVVLGVEIPLGRPQPCGEPAAAIIRCLHCGGESYACARHVKEIESMPAVTQARCGRSGRRSEILLILPLPVPFGGAR